jgi:hypothetical protein
MFKKYWIKGVEKRPRFFCFSYILFAFSYMAVAFSFYCCPFIMPPSTVQIQAIILVNYQY